MNTNKILSKINSWRRVEKFNSLHEQNQYGFTPLMSYILFYEDKNSITGFKTLTKKEFDFLLKNTDLKLYDEDGWTALMFCLKFNTKLTEEQWTYLIDGSDLLHSTSENLKANLFFFMNHNCLDNIGELNFNKVMNSLINIDLQDINHFFKEVEVINPQESIKKLWI